jgi:hypothetical protein
VRTEICSRGVLLGLLVDEPSRFDVLLVTSPGIDPPEGVQPLARRWLHLQFDDITAPFPGLRPPAARDVRRALEWGADCGDLVVACHAGVSRSAALAYLVRCLAWPPAEAIGVLTRGRHYPNELIVRLGTDLLGDPAIYEIYTGWMVESAPQQAPGSSARKRGK